LEFHCNKGKGEGSNKDCKQDVHNITSTSCVTVCGYTGTLNTQKLTVTLIDKGRAEVEG